MASIVTSEAWQPVRYAVSGGIGNYIFFHMNRALYQVFQAAAIAWTAAYLLSIPLQQILHRYIVYLGKRDESRSYIAELLALYASYSASIAVGLGLSAVMENFEVDPDIAWFVNLVVTGVVSYVLVNRAMGVSKEKKGAPEKRKRKET